MHINVNANAWYKYKPLYSEAWNDWSNGLDNMSHDVINNLDGHTKKNNYYRDKRLHKNRNTTGNWGKRQ